MISKRFQIDEENAHKRIDIFLSHEFDSISRGIVQQLIAEGKVTVNGKPTKRNYLLKLSDIIEITFELQANGEDEAQDIPIDITFENDDFFIINKNSGLTVHPGAGNKENTLVNGLMYIYKKNLSSLGGSFRPGIVHRIDKETSGLLVIAKNNLAHSKLSHQFSNHSIKRKYLCLVWGVIRPLNGKIETLISRNKKNRQLMSEMIMR